MKFKKVNALLLTFVALLSGCDKPSKMKLLSNSDYLLYGEVDDSHLFYKPTIEEFENLYNSNLNFVVMFTQAGCSACQQFEPIITQYVKETHQLLVTITDELIDPIKTKFFSSFHVMTPQIYVKENSNNFYEVNYASYMKTYGVFKRHMASRYETAKYSYFCGEIAVKTPIFSNFTKVDFVSNDMFKNNILETAISSQNNVAFSSNFESQSLSIINNDFSISKSAPINEELTLGIIKEYL